MGCNELLGPIIFMMNQSIVKQLIVHVNEFADGAHWDIAACKQMITLDWFLYYNAYFEIGR